MGQAKQRGTYEERLAQATNNNPVRLECQELYNLSDRFFNKMLERTGNDVVICKYEQHPFAQQLKCFANAERYAKQFGGKIVYGWLMLPPDSNQFRNVYKQIGVGEMHQHSVVKIGNTYIDCTPYSMKPQKGAFGGDLKFKRYFWEDNACALPAKFDNLMWVPNTGAGRRYQKQCYDLQHLDLGELGNLIPENYNDSRYYGSKPNSAYNGSKFAGIRIYDLTNDIRVFGQ
jgi:hypothetical protein